MRHCHQPLPPVQHRIPSNRKVAPVPLDDLGRVAWVGIHPPDPHAGVRELLLQPGNLRNLTVGNRALRRGKVEQDNTPTRTAQLADRSAMKVFAKLLIQLSLPWNDRKDREKPNKRCQIPNNKTRAHPSPFQLQRVLSNQRHGSSHPGAVKDQASPTAHLPWPWSRGPFRSSLARAVQSLLPSISAWRQCPSWIRSWADERRDRASRSAPA